MGAVFANFWIKWIRQVCSLKKWTLVINIWYLDICGTKQFRIESMKAAFSYLSISIFMSICPDLRFICKITVALEAWVILELEAKHVKVESTSRRWTGPTTKDEVTTSSSLTLCPRTRFWSSRPEWVSYWTTCRPFDSQWRLGLGRPAK